MPLFLFCTLAGASGRFEIEVTRDKITAGDLANLITAWSTLEPETEVGYAPLPGVERHVTRGQIAQWARSAGLELDAETLPESLVVSRKMRHLTGREAADILRQAVAAKFQVVAESVRIDLAEFDAPVIPAGELSFSLASPLPRLNQTATVPLRWTDRDGRSGVVRFRASVPIIGNFAVARRPIARGTELSAADFEIKSGALPGEPAELRLDNRQIVGKTVTRSLRPGDVLQAGMLRETPDIERGDAAAIQATSGAVVLRVPGRADAPGSAGDLIPCRNLESGRRITCRVINSTQLEAVSAQ